MPQYWNIPNVWKGRTAYLLGGGPSLSSFDFSRLAGKRVVGVNDAYRHGKEIVPVCFFGDSHWWHKHGHRSVEVPGEGWVPGFLSYEGVRVTNNLCHQYFEGHVRICKRLGNGFSSSPDTLAWNGNSGACAINLAVLLGASTIVLLGFDMHNRKAEGKTVATNYYPNMVYPPTDQNYVTFLEQFQHVKAGCENAGVRVINANPESSLTLFPKMSIEEALNEYPA